MKGVRVDSVMESATGGVLVGVTRLVNNAFPPEPSGEILEYDNMSTFVDAISNGEDLPVEKMAAIAMSRYFKVSDPAYQNIAGAAGKEILIDTVGMAAAIQLK